MKVLVNIVALSWFLIGVMVLALVIFYPHVPLALLDSWRPQAEAAAGQGQSADALLVSLFPWFAGTIWLVVFLMPALVLGALGSVLGQLDRHSDETEHQRRERSEAARRRPMTEKREPTIGRL